jgi:hypothetical protein
VSHGPKDGSAVQNGGATTTANTATQEQIVRGGLRAQRCGEGRRRGTPEHAAHEHRLL